MTENPNRYPNWIQQIHQPKISLISQLNTIDDIRTIGKDQLKEVFGDNYPWLLYTIYNRMMQNNNISLIRKPYDLSIEDSKIWSDLIDKSGSMLHRDPEFLQLLDGVFVIKEWDHFIWGIGVEKIEYSFLLWKDDIYQRIALIIDDEYKWLDLGAYLVRMCNQSYKWQKLYWYTMKSKVIDANNFSYNQVFKVHELPVLHSWFYNFSVDHRGADFSYPWGENEKYQWHYISMNDNMYEALLKDRNFAQVTSGVFTPEFDVQPA